MKVTRSLIEWIVVKQLKQLWTYPEYGRREVVKTDYDMKSYRKKNEKSGQKPVWINGILGMLRVTGFTDEYWRDREKWRQKKSLNGWRQK